jgi:hypothetical protein
MMGIEMNSRPAALASWGSLVRSTSWSSAAVSADEDVDAGGAQCGHLVNEPLAASRLGHRAEGPGTRLVDGEQVGAHLAAAATFVVRG